MNIDKAKLALLVLGIIIVCELALIGVLASVSAPVPDQAWSLVYATVGVLAGAAGAQAWNGKLQKKVVR